MNAGAIASAAPSSGVGVRREEQQNVKNRNKYKRNGENAAGTLLQFSDGFYHFGFPHGQCKVAERQG